MSKKLFLLVLSAFFAIAADAQPFVKTTQLFERKDENAGKLEIRQDPAIDTLISRYILMSKKTAEEKNNGNYGMDGWRIQIYNSSSRNAREESMKVRAEFLSKFPDIDSYRLYTDPGYYKVRVGDFRTKTQATKVLRAISRAYPNAYLVIDFINFPELKKD